MKMEKVKGAIYQMIKRASFVICANRSSFSLASGLRSGGMGL